MSGETVFAAAYAPDPGNARDVLGFVMTKSNAFVAAEDPSELMVVEDLLTNAKLAAVKRWYDLRQRSRWS